MPKGDSKFVRDVTRETASKEQIKKLEKRALQRQQMLMKLRRDKTVPRKAVKMTRDRLDKLMADIARKKKILQEK